MSRAKAFWEAAVKFFNLGPERLQSRLSEQEALAIARKAIAGIEEYAVEKGLSFTGPVPDEALDRRNVTSQYDDYLEIALEKQKGRLVWEANTSRPGDRGGHLRLRIDDETGRVVWAHVVPL